MVPGDRECKELNCGLHGACDSLIVALKLVDNANLCISACKEESICNYWTYKNSTRQCSMYEDCLEIDTTVCPECIYGEKLCPVETDPVCGLSGECIDIIVALELVNDENQCIIACKDEPLCGYWTYKASTGQCTMYEDCQEIDTNGCPTCIFGEKLCPIEAGEMKLFMFSSYVSFNSSYATF